MRSESIRSRVCRCAIVPESNIVLVPREPSVHFLGSGHHVCEVPKNGVTLTLGNPNDLSHEAGVEEQRIPTGDRVGSDERVNSGNGVAADGPAEGARVVGLHVRRVQGCQALEIGLHEWREDVISSVLRGPEGVATATTGRASQELQRCVGWWLFFVSNVRVPQEAWAEQSTVVAGVVAGVNNVDILEALLLGNRGSCMLYSINTCSHQSHPRVTYLVKSAKVLSEFPLSFDIKRLL